RGDERSDRAGSSHPVGRKPFRRRPVELLGRRHVSSSQPLAEHSVDHAAPRKLRHRKQVPPLSLKKLATATAVAVAVTACNAPSDGIAYTVPDNICQIPADKEILETLLDEGKRLKQDDGGDDITEGK